MNTDYQAILQRSKSMDDFHSSLLLVSTIYELQNYLSEADGHQEYDEANQYADLLLVYVQEYKQRIKGMFAI